MKFIKLLWMCSIISFMSCNSQKDAVKNDNPNGVAEALAGKILVTLLKDKKIETLETDFSKFELKHKSVASRSQNQHLFTFNKNLISGKDLLKKLNRSKIVYLAEPLKYNVGQPEKMTSSKKGKAVVK